MGRSAGALIAIGAAAGLFGAGCSMGYSCGGKCPTATFDLRALDDSTATWSNAGAPTQMATGLVPYPPSGSACSFRYLKGQIFGPRPDGTAETVMDGNLSLRCGGAGTGFEFYSWDLGDYRNWQAGTWQMYTPAGSFDATFPEATTGTGCYLDGMDIVATVETAIGGPLPYPKMVTDDFVRTFRLDFDTSTATPVDGIGKPCNFPLAAQVSLHLTQTATDYVYDANAPCLCE